MAARRGEGKKRPRPEDDQDDASGAGKEPRLMALQNKIDQLEQEAKERKQSVPPIFALPFLIFCSARLSDWSLRRAYPLASAAAVP